MKKITFLLFLILTLQGHDTEIILYNNLTLTAINTYKQTSSRVTAKQVLTIGLKIGSHIQKSSFNKEENQQLLSIANKIQECGDTIYNNYGLQLHIDVLIDIATGCIKNKSYEYNGISCTTLSIALNNILENPLLSFWEYLYFCEPLHNVIESITRKDFQEAHNYLNIIPSLDTKE